MDACTIPALPAKNFTFPILRPLLTLIKCIKGMNRFDAKGAPPVALRREALSNAGFIIVALKNLCKTAGIPEHKFYHIIEDIKDKQLWKAGAEGVETFCELMKTLEQFCLKNKKALGDAYRSDKETYNQLYRKCVLKRKVLLIHSKNDSCEKLAKTLSEGCYYDVDVAGATDSLEKSVSHHVTLFLCSDPLEASAFFEKNKHLGVELFLTDMGKKIPVINMDLCRIVNQAQGMGVKFINPPHVTMKILPILEEAYIQNLEKFDRSIVAQEAADAKADEALFKGMEEALLYAELIVEAHWKKLAGYSMEKEVFAALN